MNEDNFNMAIRRFLKEVGITSQRAIEKAVGEAIAAGRLQGNETLRARMTLTINQVNLTTVIDREISLD